jgi:hypothetical protein
MAEEAGERPDKEWRGSPLQMWSGLDPYGIKEIVLEFDTGDEGLEASHARRVPLLRAAPGGHVS